MISRTSLLKKSNWSLIGVAVFCLLLIGLVWDSQLKHIQQDHRDTVREVVQRNNNRVAALEQYTIRTIKNADAVLQMVRKDFAMVSFHHRGPLALPQAAANDLFSAVLVADVQGELVAFNSAQSSGTIHNLKELEYFRFHAHHSFDSLFIGKPVFCPVLGHQVIPLSRRLSTPDGRFAGVAAVLIEPTTFTRFYAQASLLPRDILSLIAPDGTTYARRTGAQESFGENISKSPLFAHVARRPVGSYFAPDAIHGIATYFSYRRLKDYPMIATVGAAETEALAAYYERTNREYRSTVMISVLLLLFSGLVCYFLLAQRRQEKIIIDSETRYRSFFENSLDAILITRPNGQVLAANPAACLIFGRSVGELCSAGCDGLVDLSDPRFLELIHERNLTGKARGEFTLVRKDGTTFPGEVASALFTDGNGEVFSTMIIRDVTRQKDLQRQILQEQKRFQRKLTEQVIRAQEREREAIGRELHDNVNQVLTTVKLYLELAQADRSSCEVLLPRCTGHLMDSINEIRRLSHDLSAPTLGTRSLVDSAEALINMIRSSTGLRITLRHNKKHTTLPMDMKLAVYRILQEQLNNVVRHAGATKVLITLWEQPDHLMVTVKDNGRGFDRTQRREGIGINNIISRAKVFEGKVSIDSAPGQGCTLQVVIPVAELSSRETAPAEDAPYPRALHA